MKNPILFALTSVLISFSAVLAGCGESGPKGNSVNNGVAGTCTPGTVFVTAYNGCFSTAACATFGTNYGYVPQVGQCLPGLVTGAGAINTGYSRHLWSGAMNITNPELYREMMKSQGVCGGGWLNTLSGYNCEQWDDFAALAFEINGTGVLPAAGVGTVVSYYDYSPYVVLSTPYSGLTTAINQNTAFGFQSQGMGTAYSKTIRFEGNVGLLLNGTTFVTQYRLRLLFNEQEVGFSDVTLRY